MTDFVVELVSGIAEIVIELLIELIGPQIGRLMKKRKQGKVSRRI